jgi:hypothetical protein
MRALHASTHVSREVRLTRERRKRVMVVSVRE